MALGDALASPTSRLYCGGRRGRRHARDVRRRVLAVAEGGRRRAGGVQDSDDPAAWNADADAERIRFLPGAALSMHWVNRPTTQQLAMFGRLGRTPTDRVRAASGGRSRGSAPARAVAAFACACARASACAWICCAAKAVVRSFGRRRGAFAWAGARGLPSGYYVLRVRGRDVDGVRTRRTVALRYRRGRFRRLKPFERHRSCGAVRRASLGAPVFRRRLTVRVTLAERATLTAAIGRRRTRARTLAPGNHRIRIPVRGLRPGAYTLTLRVRGAFRCASARVAPD